MANEENDGQQEVIVPDLAEVFERNIAKAIAESVSIKDWPGIAGWAYTASKLPGKTR